MALVTRTDKHDKRDKTRRGTKGGARSSDRAISKRATPDPARDLSGVQADMFPQPLVISPDYRGSGKLEGKVALIAGGDSGIGRSVAIHYAREGADIAFVYLSEDEDAEDACAMIEAEGRKCLVLRGDVGDVKFCRECVESVIQEFGHLDILVNNASEQTGRENLEDITEERLARTFRTNIYSMFFLTQAALPYMKEESCVINTSSVNAYRGNEDFVDDSATKGAIMSFTRSLAKAAMYE